MKYLIIVIGIFYGCHSNKSIMITEFSFPYNAIDTTELPGKTLLYYNNYFLISDYSNSKIIEDKIDSFVLKFTSSHSYSNYTEEIRLSFYKESTHTNLAEIKKNAREVDRHSDDDLVYLYSVKLNGTVMREKYKSGQIIETTDKNIPTPKFKIIREK